MTDGTFVTIVKFAEGAGGMKRTLSARYYQSREAAVSGTACHAKQRSCNRVQVCWGQTILRHACRWIDRQWIGNLGLNVGNKIPWNIRIAEFKLRNVLAAENRKVGTKILLWG